MGNSPEDFLKSPAKIKEPREGAKYFDQFQQMVRHPLPEMQEYFERELEYLSRLLTSESSVMDIGCGPARVMRELAPKVKRIVGIERDPRMIEEGKKALEGIPGNYEFWQIDFFALQPEQAFDLVFASYNLPGADDIKPEDRKLLLEKMIMNTRPGGNTVASFWKPTDPEWLQTYYHAAGAEMREIRGNVVETSVGTFTRFTDDEIKQLADSLGVPYSIKQLTSMFDLVHFHPGAESSGV
jgi:ubiquinone/menaquinone biosynthesis C-methylase UbiE